MKECGHSMRTGIAERASFKTNTDSNSSKTPKAVVAKADSSVSAAAPPKWFLVSLFAAIWKEWCDFLSALHLVLTRHPLKTAAAVSVIVLFCHLRCQGKLHLLVFPVLFLATLTYFELFR